MGFTFRKRNAKGFNVSLSSRGLRISKTAKMGKTTANVGRYFGGTHDGKVTGNVRANAGDVQYRKDFTLNKKPRGQGGATIGFLDPGVYKSLTWIMLLMVNAIVSVFYSFHLTKPVFMVLGFDYPLPDGVSVPYLVNVALALFMFYLPWRYYVKKTGRLENYQEGMKTPPLFGTVFVLYIIILVALIGSTIYQLM